MEKKINKPHIPCHPGFLIILLFLLPIKLFAQTPTRIAVIPVKNRSGFPEYTTLCETVTDTVTSVIRFLPGYILVESTDNPAMLQADISNLEEVKALASDSGYGEVLFGELIRNDAGKLQFDMQIYSLEEEDIIVRQTSVSDTLLDVFDTADTMTLDLLGQITDVNIGFGSIELIKEAGEGTYEVYLNGKRIRNPRKNFRRVLNGAYTLEIRQERLQGERTVYSNKIYINEFQTTAVSFSIPEATAAEKEYLIELKEDVIAASEDPENLDLFLEKIARFQELTKSLDYDPGMEAEKDLILDEVGERAAEVLENVMEDADSRYYAKNPDFESAYSLYSRVSGLINNVFDYSTADPGRIGSLVEPHWIAVTEEGSFFLIDNPDAPRISFFDADFSLISSRSLESLAGSLEGISIDLDREGNCFFYSSSRPETVFRFGQDLTNFTELPITGFEAVPGNELHLALSEEDVVYLIGPDSYVVFEYTIGNTVFIERDSIIEQALRQRLQTEPGLVIAKIFFDSANVLNIFSVESSTVYRFSALGESKEPVSIPLAQPGSDLSVDSLGYFYLTLPEDHAIVKYSFEGEQVTMFGGYGSDSGQFAGPRGLDLDSGGNMYVADTLNNRVQVLSLAAPPLLLPEVAQFGEKFSRREKSSEEAIDTVRGLGPRIDPGFFRDLWRAGFPLLLMGSSFAAGLLDGAFYFAAMDSYGQYQSAAGEDEVTALWGEYVGNVVLSRSFLIAGYGTMALGSFLLASRLADAIDGRVEASRTVERLQLFDMDADYVLTEPRFRSLETAYVLGAVTGVVPPVLGGALYLVLSVFPEVPPSVAVGVAGGLNLIPPIFAHAYSGELSWRALVTGLIADLFAVTAFGLARDESRTAALSGFTDPAERGAAYRQDNFEKYVLSELFIVASTVFRLVAGIQDMKGGWKSAHAYNVYRAVEKKSADISFQAAPYLSGDKRVGLAFGLQF